MIHNPWLLTLLLPLCLLSCNNPNQEYAAVNDENAANLDFKFKSVARQFGSCLGAGAPCARIQFKFPEAIYGSNAAIESSNAIIKNQLVTGVSTLNNTDLPTGISLDSVASLLVEQYQVQLEEMGDYAQAWEVQVNANMLFQTPKLTAIEMDFISNVGGVAGLKIKQLMNFDLKSGKLISLEALIANPAQLLTLAEEKFREVHDLSVDKNLNEAGFFWDKDFTLTQNFALTAEGLYFHYNPYEVASFSEGSTNFTIPYEALEEILITDLGL